STNRVAITPPAIATSSTASISQRYRRTAPRARSSGWPGSAAGGSPGSGNWSAVASDEGTSCSGAAASDMAFMVRRSLSYGQATVAETVLLDSGNRPKQTRCGKTQRDYRQPRKVALLRYEDLITRSQVETIERHAVGQRRARVLSVPDDVRPPTDHDT